MALQYKNVALSPEAHKMLEEIIEHRRAQTSIKWAKNAQLTDLIIGAHIRMKREQQKAK